MFSGFEGAKCLCPLAPGKYCVDNGMNLVLFQESVHLLKGFPAARRENMSPLVRRLIDFAVHLGQQMGAERSAKLVA